MEVGARDEPQEGRVEDVVQRDKMVGKSVRTPEEHGHGYERENSVGRRLLDHGSTLSIGIDTLVCGWAYHSCVIPDYVVSRSS